MVIGGVEIFSYRRDRIYIAAGLVWQVVGGGAVASELGSLYYSARCSGCWRSHNSSNRHTKVDRRGITVTARAWGPRTRRRKNFFVSSKEGKDA